VASGARELASGEAEKAPGGRARLGVLFSGGGRTLENLAHRSADGSLPAEIAIAVSSHREAGGLERARRAGIPSRVVDYREPGGDFSRRIWAILEEARVEWVALAGFIRHLAVPGEFAGRVLNIHPALLPAFGGKGFYGDRVHRAVLEAGAKFTGCTVHFVTADYDAGPIIIQRLIAVNPGETVESLAERVFAEECIAYPEALRLCISGRVEIDGGMARIRQGS
jgi:phosphoribosylglycinamide formyltransferase-1